MSQSLGQTGIAAIISQSKKKLNNKQQMITEQKP